MYNYEQRKKAVELYIQFGFALRAVIRELGYPTSEQSIRNWYKEYKENGELHQELDSPFKYTPEQKVFAVQHYLQHGKCLSRTVKMLGYPCRQLLREWVMEVAPDTLRPCKSDTASIYLSQSQKEQAVVALCTRQKSAREVAADYGMTRDALYYWKNKLLPKEKAQEMAAKKNMQPLQSREELEAQAVELRSEVSQLTQQVEELKRQVHQLDLEKAILETAAEVLKKDQGISISTLTNKEKAIVINALRERFPLHELLSAIKMAKSSYCYQVNALRFDKYESLRGKVRQAFKDSKNRYGYRRIHVVVTACGQTISEKVIRRLMKEEGLVVHSVKRKKYSSYQGEISPAVENVVARDFHADHPNEKWLTDITEFHIPAGKVYLSPLIDCFDGMPVSWTIGTSPDAELVNTMLDEGIKTLSGEERPLVHSDRGAHYRWPGWIERMEKAGLTRSMSKKGCSPDNSACEGFFGRMKNEMFYGYSWQDISIDQFITEVDEYMHWYAEKRVKVSLGGLSPLEYRRKLGIAI